MIAESLGAGLAVVLPAHLGPLHPIEQGLTVVLAFGPFVVLALVVMWRRRHDTDEDADLEPDTDAETSAETGTQTGAVATPPAQPER